MFLFTYTFVPNMLWYANMNLMVDHLIGKLQKRFHNIADPRNGNDRDREAAEHMAGELYPWL